ncbi:MAG: ATP-binding protein [Candidatus Eremiobacteraeota bacterium]|nr:ATP-binding protein [Candidatus Eremiobacteraeota bacterium]
MRILVTGMSGTGKSALMSEFASRGYFTVDIDEPTLGLTYPRARGEVGWNVHAVRDLLSQTTASPLFCAGCSDEQAELYNEFDYIVLLSAPQDTLRQRLASRVGNNYGKSPEQLAAVLRYVETVEPLLRRRADLEVVTTIEVACVADIILQRVAERTTLIRNSSESAASG